jgi:hypothetical protein
LEFYPLQNIKLRKHSGYGLDNTTERSTISEIVKRLMIGVHGKKMVKEIIVVYNKLIIYNENQFDMVICKT